MDGRGESARALRERLAAARGLPLRLYQTEALYNLQVEWTCKLLDAVDEVADRTVAVMITDVIWEKLSGEGASAAAGRIREAQAEMERLARTPPALFWPPRDGQA